VGETVGELDGEDVGETMGELDGEDVGETVGELDGEDVGETVGELDGEAVGCMIGDRVGLTVGVGKRFETNNNRIYESVPSARLSVEMCSEARLGHSAGID
jgi:hypothetical protein